MHFGVVTPKQFEGTLQTSTEGTARVLANQIAKLRNKGVYTVDQIPVESINDNGVYNPTFLQQKLTPLNSKRILTPHEIRSVIKLSLNSKKYGDAHYGNVAFDNSGNA
jgi:hypothetical protein